MYCQLCGTQNDGNAWKCVKCGEVLQRSAPPGVQPQRIPNYLAQSILVTVFCCLPFGIPAIVYSAQVNGKVQSGDIQGATDSSRKARMWGWISFGVGLAVWVIYGVAAIISAAAGS
jgi:hypothetical protein